MTALPSIGNEDNWSRTDLAWCPFVNVPRTLRAAVLGNEVRIFTIIKVLCEVLGVAEVRDELRSPSPYAVRDECRPLCESLPVLRGVPCSIAVDPGNLNLVWRPEEAEIVDEMRDLVPPPSTRMDTSPDVSALCSEITGGRGGEGYYLTTATVLKRILELFENSVLDPFSIPIPSEVSAITEILLVRYLLKSLLTSSESAGGELVSVVMKPRARLHGRFLSYTLIEHLLFNEDINTVRSLWSKIWETHKAFLENCAPQQAAEVLECLNSLESKKLTRDVVYDFIGLMFDDDKAPNRLVKAFELPTSLSLCACRLLRFYSCASALLEPRAKKYLRNLGALSALVGSPSHTVLDLMLFMNAIVNGMVLIPSIEIELISAIDSYPEPEIEIPEADYVVIVFQPEPTRAGVQLRPSIVLIEQTFSRKLNDRKRRQLKSLAELSRKLQENLSIDVGIALVQPCTASSTKEHSTLEKSSRCKIIRNIIAPRLGTAINERSEEKRDKESIDISSTENIPIVCMEALMNPLTFSIAILSTIKQHSPSAWTYTTTTTQ